MDYILDRQIFTQRSTIGQWMNPRTGLREFWSLEDFDRGLVDTMTEEEIRGIKVYGKTAIPYGTYEVKITASPKFGIETPELFGVKGFKSIRVHSGVNPDHTEGCVLCGQDRGQDEIYHGRRAFRVFMPKLRTILSLERVFVHVVREHYKIDPITNAILSGAADVGPVPLSNLGGGNKKDPDPLAVMPPGQPLGRG